MCPIQACRLMIFISDFKCDFSVPQESVLRLLQEILQYVECRGHQITFAYVLYVPVYSRDPCTKPSFSPQTDNANNSIAINDQLKAFTLLNPLKACFSHKKVDMNSKKYGYKGPNWLVYSSTVAPHFRFQNCFYYNTSILRQRYFDFYVHVIS